MGLDSFSAFNRSVSTTNLPYSKDSTIENTVQAWDGSPIVLLPEAQRPESQASQATQRRPAFAMVNEPLA